MEQKLKTAGDEGHRARLRARFDQAGERALADYELLELLLFRAIPRRDVKPLARALLAEFGDFGDVLGAPLSRLMKIPGMGEAAARELKITAAAAARLTRAGVTGRDVISSWDALITYCRAAMARLDTEEARLIFLDRKNVLIADETQGRGTVGHVQIYPREVARRALELNASALILVHNHPSGDPAPSKADIEMTKLIRAALDTVGVTLHDHVVIGKGREVSFRAMGLI